MNLAKPEQISNSYGTVYKFAGGTMIQVYTVETTTNSASITFVEPFIQPPVAFVTNVFSYSAAIIWSVGSTGLTSMNVYLHIVTGDPEIRNAIVIVIGRWK